MQLSHISKKIITITASSHTEWKRIYGMHSLSQRQKNKGCNGGPLMGTSFVVVAWSNQNHQISWYVAFEQGLHEGIMRTPRGHSRRNACTN